MNAFIVLHFVPAACVRAAADDGSIASSCPRDGHIIYIHIRYKDPSSGFVDPEVYRPPSKSYVESGAHACALKTYTPYTLDPESDGDGSSNGIEPGTAGPRHT